MPFSIGYKLSLTATPRDYLRRFDDDKTADILRVAEEIQALIGRLARLRGNVGQPDHILANPVIRHQAERRPRSGEIGFAATSTKRIVRCGNHRVTRGAPDIE